MKGIQCLNATGLAGRRWRTMLSGGILAAAVSFAFVSLPSSALAQMQRDTGLENAIASPLQANIKPGEQMLVESDQLVYDYDNNNVSAVGNVRIYYGGYTLEAEKVTYLRSSGRLLATGHVKLTHPDGAVFYSEQFDITDDFADGFVESLRVETVDRTYFAASRAEREGGERTTFVKGVYTACEPCRERPEKPPLWQVKAAKIIVDQKEKMIYFRDASFEFLGVPIAWVPFFSTADPSVKRKSGFLTPGIAHSNTLGTTISTPYFWALAPNYDVTLTPTYMTEQGFMGQVEWRHRLQNGQYTLQMAGINQQDPGAFRKGPDNDPTSGEYADRDFRGGIRTTGEFDINKNWSYGWDITAQTDRTFTRHYDVLNSDRDFATSEAHLTGMSDRNWFDMRGYYFQVLTDKPRDPTYDQERQAIVAPVVDYNYIFDDPVWGGQLSVKSNLTALHREESSPFMVENSGDHLVPTDPRHYTEYLINGSPYYTGLGGTYVRASTEVTWERQFIGPMGQVITPFAYLRADAFSLDPNDAAATTALTGDDLAVRAIPAVGFEWSLPVMASTPNSTHVFEPMVQVIARPDTAYSGELPNDDSQSLVFDDANLFQRDKYSGYDLAESGVRANVGLKYRGTFSNGASIEGLFGQSFNLAGDNPFSEAGVSNTGPDSGLESDRSDYVAGLSFDSGFGPRLDFRGRFDEDDFEIQRGEIEATNTLGPLTASATYLFLREFPNDPQAETPISVVRASGSINFLDNWRAFGTIAYDLENSKIASNSIGLAYDDSCLTLAIAYSETHEDYSDIVASRRVSVLLQLRTLGEAQYRTDISGYVND